MKKADYTRIEEFLDERYLICCMTRDERKADNLNEDGYDADKIYYRGALAAVEMMGFDWVRHENGKHRVFKG